MISMIFMGPMKSVSSMISMVPMQLKSAQTTHPTLKYLSPQEVFVLYLIVLCAMQGYFAHHAEWVHQGLIVVFTSKCLSKVMFLRQKCCKKAKQVGGGQQMPWTAGPHRSWKSMTNVITSRAFVNLGFQESVSVSMLFLT